MRKLWQWYGASPVQLLGLLAAFAVAGYAALQLVPADPIGVALWFAGGVVLHDLVLLPIYSLANLSVAKVAPSRSWLNHVRVPFVLSALLFVVFFPSILGLPGALSSTLGREPQPILLHWLLITGALFGGSAVLLAVRLRSPLRDQQVLKEKGGTGLDGEPPAVLGGGEQRAAGEQPGRERQPDPFDLGLAHPGQARHDDAGQRGENGDDDAAPDAGAAKTGGDGRSGGQRERAEVGPDPVAVRPESADALVVADDELFVPLPPGEPADGHGENDSGRTGAGEERGPEAPAGDEHGQGRDG